MSGFAENTTFDKSNKRHNHNQVMNLTTAYKMLPLVSRIVGDILNHQCRLDVLRPEQARLDRHKRDLVWQERERRYAVQEEISQLGKDLQAHFSELEVLGVALEESEVGRVGFPTLVNDRPAFFTWKLGDDSILNWHFLGEKRYRVIPKSWFEAENIPVPENN